MWQDGEMDPGGAYRSGTSSISPEWGGGNNHRLLAFSQKEYSFSWDKLLSQTSQILNINNFIIMVLINVGRQL